MYKKFVSDIKTLLVTGEECKPIHITLTIKDVKADQVTTSIDILLQSWERLMANKLYKDNVKGFVRSIEVPHNTTRNTYHPHIHALWFVSLRNPDISLEQLKLDWAKALSLNYEPAVSFDYLY